MIRRSSDVYDALLDVYDALLMSQPPDSEPLAIRGSRVDEEYLPTPLGTARAATYRASRPRARLVLGHGAGRGIDSPDLAYLATALPSRRIETVLVEQPWRVAGGRVASAPARLDLAWLAVLEHLRRRADPLQLVVGGRSAGARVACRTAAAVGAIGVLALAFPLHPPGRPGQTRLPELLGAGVSTLAVQGTRDVFGTPADFPAEVRVCAVPYADHGFAVPASAPITRHEALALVADAAAWWVHAACRSVALRP
jgi:predicted alpha/beta-hydrolase family hydrolase